jgi:MoxR-like ATPase
MNATAAKTEKEFRQVQGQLEQLAAALNGVLVGQERLVAELLSALFSGGHVLLEGLPGLGKTTLAKAFAASLSFDLGRIQCTPDLMPADITGSEVLVRTSAGTELFDFRRGPLFAPMVLVDEINRATPKTQAALLEAMQERQVTYAGKRHPLPKPFWVVATQNPIELEGTYPLPEAQLDRFAMQIQVEFPSDDALLTLADLALAEEPAERIARQLDAEAVASIMQIAREVYCATPIKRAAVDLVTATHPDHTNALPLARKHLRYGASPRALQALLRVGRTHALLAGRAHVAIDDLAAIAKPVLRHRVLLRVESELDGTSVDDVLDESIRLWRERS